MSNRTTERQRTRHALGADARSDLGEHQGGTPDGRCVCGHGTLRHVDGRACIAWFNGMPCMCKALRSPS